MPPENPPQVRGGRAPAENPAPTRYQGKVHELQKELMGAYYAELTDIAKGRSAKKNAHLLIAGNPVELVRAFDMLPVFPEVNVLQIAARKGSLPLIQKAEELGYAVDNCAYVKADVGLYLAGYEAPYGTIPKADLLLCNYVGCNVYLNWFGTRRAHGPAVNIDIRSSAADGEPSTGHRYVVKQLEGSSAARDITGKALMEEAGAHGRAVGAWASGRRSGPSQLRRRDALRLGTMMAVLYCLRGPEAVSSEIALADLEERSGEAGTRRRSAGSSSRAPPWPFLRVSATCSAAGARWPSRRRTPRSADLGVRFARSAHPLEASRAMLSQNLCNRTFLQRYDQMGDT
jgi:hypothetical protein